MNGDVLQAYEVLRNGGIILYPTDTIWGIGCDATNAGAVARIYALKNRDDRKAMSVLVEHDNRLQTYVREVPEMAYTLIEFAENPLTIVYPAAKNLAPNLIAADGSIGIRVVKHAFCEKLIGRLRKPLVSTSANISGQPAPQTFADVDKTIKNGVDYIVKAEQNFSGKRSPSTIIRLEADGRFAFIRR